MGKRCGECIMLSIVADFFVGDNVLVQRGRRSNRGKHNCECVLHFHIFMVYAISCIASSAASVEADISVGLCCGAYMRFSKRAPSRRESTWFTLVAKVAML